MRVISKKTIEDFYKTHPQSKGALLSWYKRFISVEWRDFNHLRYEFSSVDFVGHNHYVFNIKGNNYRLVVVIQFTPQLALIRFIGTHKEYDRIKDISTI